MRHVKTFFSLCVVLLLLLPATLHAQRNLEKANRFFGLNQFEKAIPFFIKEMKEGASSEDKLEAAYRLADCYRLLGDFENAEEIYKKLMRKGGAEAMFSYGSALKAAAKYAEAKKVFEKYVRKKPNDPRGSMMLKSCDIAQKLLDAEWQYDVRELSSINTPNEEISPIVYRGGIVFSSQRPGGLKPFISLDGGNEVLLDLYFIEFDGTETSLTNKPYLFPGLNTSMHEGPASFTSDGQTVYYTTTVKGKRKSKGDDVVQNTLQIFVSELSGNPAFWSEGRSAIPANSFKYSVMHPSVSSDGNMMVFASNMAGGYGGTDLYIIYRKKDGEWSAPYNLGPDVNSSENELFPFYNNDGRVYFSSNGHPGMGKLDIFECYLDREYGWTGVRNLGVPINSIGDDICFTEIENTGRGLFVSDRINGTGKADIYAYSKIQPLEIELDEERVWIKDNSAFNAFTYGLTNAETKEELNLDKYRGYYNFTPKPGIEYQLAIRKDGFSFNRIIFSISNNEHGNRELHILPKKGDIKIKQYTGQALAKSDSLGILQNLANFEEKKISLFERIKIAIMGATTEEYDISKLLSYEPVNIHENLELEPGVAVKLDIDDTTVEEKQSNEQGFASFIIPKKDQGVLTVMRNFEGKRIPFPYNSAEEDESVE